MTAFLGVVFIRAIITIAGAIAIYCGYRLFYVATEKQGELNVKLGANHQLGLREVGPGVFFALFGAIILVVCLVYPMKYEETTNSDKIQVQGGPLPQGEPMPIIVAPPPSQEPPLRSFRLDAPPSPEKR
jgi:hypothetical protein